MRFIGLFALLLAWVPFRSSAQQGDYFMTHVIPPHLDRSYQIFDMDQDATGILYLAHRGGILVFDGREWENRTSPGSVFAISVADDGIFTGGPNGFHKVQIEENNSWSFTHLHSNDAVKDIVDIYRTTDKLFGISAREVYSYDLVTKEIIRFDVAEDEIWHSLFAGDGEIHVLAESGNVYRINDSRLLHVTEGIGSRSLRFVATSPSGKEFLAGTTANELYIYSENFSRLLSDAVDRRDREYLQDNVVTDGRWVNDSLLAVSTLKGGVVFISPDGKSGRKVNKIVNYQTSLPDNQVFFMHVDNENALWINHERGLTRIDPASPMRRFDRFPGLEGELKSVLKFDGKLYAGTTEGLFFLNETPLYEKIRTREDRYVKISPSTKRGFFNKLFGKKDEDVVKKQTVTNVTRQFHSIRHEFVRIGDIDTKVLGFQVAENKLFTMGVGGVYLIDGTSARQLLNEPVRYLYRDETTSVLLGATYEGVVYEIGTTGEMHARKLHRFPEQINHILRDSRGTTFYVGMHTLYVQKNGEPGATQVPFSNSHYDQTYGYLRNDSLFIVNNRFAGYLDLIEGKVTPVAKAVSHGSIIPGANGLLWTETSEGWIKSASMQADNAFRHLRILHGIDYISEDSETRGRWVITSGTTDDGALYHVERQKDYGTKTPHTLHLSRVVTNLSEFSPGQSLVFSPENTTITFHLSQPEFSNLVETQFMYQLEGEEEEWSEWSADNNIIRFTYLPAGNYSLRIRSRNSLGQVDEINLIEFEVLSPYWKQTWFYAVEFAIIALMLLISLRMKSTRYLWVSRLLALLTLITIIELIQAVAESRFETETSPVFGFIIQVIVAFMILPVEEIVRKYIFKGSDAKFIDLIRLAKKNQKEAQLPD